MNTAGSWLLHLGALKPVLTALVLPPAGPLLLMLPGCFCLTRKRLRGAGWMLVGAVVISLWLLSCQGMAVWLERHILPPVATQSPEQLRAQQVQAVVVLGGGVQPVNEEYDQPQLTSWAFERLRYGAWLARRLQLPLGYAGGLGWAQTPGVPSEAAVASQLAPEHLGVAVAFGEGQSRDTAENGRNMLIELRRRHITRIALVTHAWHMPRALRAFRADDVVVIPAPMGRTHRLESDLLDWLPSGLGLRSSRNIVREWLGLQLL